MLELLSEVSHCDDRCSEFIEVLTFDDHEFLKPQNEFACTSAQTLTDFEIECEMRQQQQIAGELQQVITSYYVTGEGFE